MQTVLMQEPPSWSRRQQGGQAARHVYSQACVSEEQCTGLAIRLQAGRNTCKLAGTQVATPLPSLCVSDSACAFCYAHVVA